MHRRYKRKKNVKNLKRRLKFFKLQISVILLFIKNKRNSKLTQNQVIFSKGLESSALTLTLVSFVLSFWLKIKPSIKKLLITKRHVNGFKIILIYYYYNFL